ncbi:lipid-A-disaccharide kinase [Dyadobacter koreensis]|uniref:Tetraacyldisaccharide 4'-kinase n=1 Tax=Dyadobacter koreensis TaxID=408657 RepID=A0A1H6TCD8_9BACT|nr:tetraacyldisaccharide 4'-kinase [Dyadobacter koreensis]SEI74757.1 lipid-A-disaccharide kinase [Dyadobacter koreensis]
MAEHNWIKLILTPFSWVYGLITLLRNFLYAQGFLSTQKAPQFTISVGNLTVGGTGKTPVVEYLTKLLSRKYKVAILSRGYGRKTKGLVFADASSSASDIGDEPLQYFSKFGKNIVVAVSEKRINGALAINEISPERDLLLLDDAYQHRAIQRQINILLNDFNRPFYKDLPFPAGRLRETRRGANRADAIIVTKAPKELPELNKEEIRKAIRTYCRKTAPIFFTTIRYSAPVGYDWSHVLLKNVIIVAGIANPLPFTVYLRTQYHVIDEIIFPDHHNYTIADLEHLIKYIKNDTFVVTTEKDMVKLKPLAVLSGVADRFAYLPMEMDFGADSEAFDQWILKNTP